MPVLSCTAFGHIWQFCGLKVGILGTQSPKYLKEKGLQTGPISMGCQHSAESERKCQKSEKNNESDYLPVRKSVSPKVWKPVMQTVITQCNLQSI